MMPLAPQLSVPHLGQISATPNIRSTMKASKPKLSFSIDSIVGKRKIFESSEQDETEQINETELLEKSIKRHFGERCSPEASPTSPGGSRSPEAAQQRRSVSPQSNGSLRTTPNDALPEGGSPGRSLSPLSLVTHAANIQSPGQMSGLPSQFLTRACTLQTAPGANHSSISPIPQPGAGQVPLGHPSHQMMVAAAAAAAATSAHQFPSMPSEYQQFYPWFLRANPFAGRFPGMPFDATLGSFLLPPFRKPKRIRTAFSPGQLLKLEQAFEKNHYVVGNERKQLANHLGLSETQVKVWFQNRRTKHKRQKQEDEESGSGSATNGESGVATSKDFTDDEEEIDLEDDEDCNSDQEHDNGVVPSATNPATAAALKFANMHHLWYQSMGVSGGLVAADHPPSGST